LGSIAKAAARPPHSKSVRARRGWARWLWALKEILHEQSEHHAVQSIRVRVAEALPLRARSQTPHPTVSMNSRNAICDALFHDDFVAGAARRQP
jgi:hypothetical protein